MGVKHEGNIYHYIKDIPPYASPRLDENARARLTPVSFGTVTWTLTVEYRRDFRGDSETFTKTLPSNEWFYFGDVIKGSKLCGGRAILVWKWTWFGVILISAGIDVFYIRGENPTPYTAEYVIGESPWYAKAIVRHESGYQNGRTYLQFNEEGSLGTDWDDYKDCPNRSSDKTGWGMFQLDNPPAKSQELWDWKANVAEAKRRMSQYASEARNWIVRQESQQQVERPDLPLENETFSFGTRRNIHFRKGTSRTPQDACAIQRYNGASLWVIYWKNKTDTYPGSWEIRETHRSYVDNICDKL